jgi:hypothetical protein
MAAACTCAVRWPCARRRQRSGQGSAHLMLFSDSVLIIGSSAFHTTMSGFHTSVWPGCGFAHPARRHQQVTEGSGWSRPSFRRSGRQLPGPSLPGGRGVPPCLALRLCHPRLLVQTAIPVTRTHVAGAPADPSNWALPTTIVWTRPRLQQLHTHRAPGRLPSPAGPRRVVDPPT